MATKKKLVIVESPAKARTLGKILGKSYDLKASIGHIRDLPKSQIGVDVESDFSPRYVIPKDKTKVVNELKKAAGVASAVYLATDPDREGEAIAWHLAEVTSLDSKTYYRVVFHEITEEAVRYAFQHPRDIDAGLVDAQQARRILDRLVGYKISPLLWRKVRRRLSAGRVQSVAVKIIVDREKEIEAFTPVEYWVIEVELAGQREKTTFKATLISLKDGTKLEIHDESAATSVKAELKKSAYSVSDVNVKKSTRQPAPPFITSTMQQEAWRKLRFSARQTMAVAQQLYEGLPLGSEGSVGLITYMRTDSTHVAATAIEETREYIKRKYGAKYLPARPRAFTRRVAGAQEAHEAIRPTRTIREPAQIKKYLNNNQFKLYDLIWKRMVASQMAAAQFDNTTVTIEAANPAKTYLLRTGSSVNTFPGFITLYSEGRDEADEEAGGKLPGLKKGEGLKLIDVFSDQRFTQPPPRYTEATLVKALEQWGIGRPSTYAPILSTIQEREYVNRLEGSFRPTVLGIAVNDLLVQFFPDIINVKFTAGMESELDDIAKRQRRWTEVIRNMYTPLENDLQKAMKLAEKVEIPVELSEETCPECGKPLAIRSGRFGKFLACTGYPECRFTKSFQIKTGVKCPEDGCDGELVQRISRKKRVFYGCSNYPKCKFATYLKPIPQPCPECGGLLTAYRGSQAKCTRCDFKGKPPRE